MRSKVLLVEDCPEHRQIIGSALHDLCTVVPAETVAEAKSRIEDDVFDLILLDVELPDGSGYDFCSRLRTGPDGFRTPIVFLTGRSTSDDVLSGFCAGGTDYILKPCHPAELRARVHARLRTLEQTRPPKDHATSGEWMFSGNLRFNLVKRLVEVEEPQGYFREIALTPSEFRLLCYFVRNPGLVLSRDRLLLDVWRARSAIMSDRAVDVHICQLRKKMPQSGPCRIEAVYGEGYRYSDGGGNA